MIARGVLDLFGLRIAQVFALPRSSPRVSITINQPLALLHTYRIPETLFTANLHNALVVCFSCCVGTKTQRYRTVKSAKM